MPPDISIITPCYNMLDYLPQCVKSVSDQEVCFEHIIIDGGSADGIEKWLQQQNHNNVNWISEKDNGMYDALNKGLAMATGEIIGHLNADEQYLEGALKSVVNFFDTHPEIDFVFGDFLLVNNHGELIAFRKSFPLFWPFYFSNYLYAYTCTLFYRKKIIDVLKYDATLKSIADVDFVYKMQKMGFKGAHLKKYIAAFTHTGNNLSTSPVTVIERCAYEKKNLPKWFDIIKPFLRLGFLGARVVFGTLWHKGEIKYGLYSRDNLSLRKRFIKNNPTYKWSQSVVDHS